MNPPDGHVKWLESKGFQRVPKTTSWSDCWGTVFAFSKEKTGFVWKITAPGETGEWVGTPGGHPASAAFDFPRTYVRALDNGPGNIPSVYLQVLSTSPPPKTHQAWLAARGFERNHSQHPRLKLVFEVWSHAQANLHLGYSFSRTKGAFGWGILPNEFPRYFLAKDSSSDFFRAYADSVFVYATPFKTLRSLVRPYQDAEKSAKENLDRALKVVEIGVGAQYQRARQKLEQIEAVIRG